jgi:hypothetical protein
MAIPDDPTGLRLVQVADELDVELPVRSESRRPLYSMVIYNDQSHFASLVMPLTEAPQLRPSHRRVRLSAVLMPSALEIGCALNSGA